MRGSVYDFSGPVGEPLPAAAVQLTRSLQMVMVLIEC
jgi:hypothetical protein